MNSMKLSSDLTGWTLIAVKTTHVEIGEKGRGESED